MSGTPRYAFDAGAYRKGVMGVPLGLFGVALRDR